MTDQIHLYVIEQNPERAKRLEAELKMLPLVSVFQTYADAVAASHGFDAVFVPLMSAMEWGVITPSDPWHRTRVVKTPDYEVLRGRPKYSIPGVATSPGESLSPFEATQLVLQESFKAIRSFNHLSDFQLKSVGVAALSLGLEKLKNGEAASLLRNAYQFLAA